MSPLARPILKLSTMQKLFLTVASTTRSQPSNKFSLHLVHGQGRLTKLLPILLSSFETIENLRQTFDETLMLVTKGIDFINNNNLTKSLQPLSHRRYVADLAIFYRFYQSQSSEEIRDMTPGPLRHTQNNKQSSSAQTFKVSLRNGRNQSHNSSFLPRSRKLWNALPPLLFPRPLQPFFIQNKSKQT